ncbi:MAG: SpoIVB peptidase [Bacilli bacterium]|nr:SpoIVB peptidase [Bacilli bacterium]MDD4547836.1 SpoIVB peptidase [Bacilli bacterium]
MMIFKKIKKTCLTFLLVLSILPSYVLAYSEYIIPGGENIGIELNSSGVMIVGLYKVNNNYPAHEAGLRVGDIILEINDEKVNSINSLVDKINKTTSTNKVTVKYNRDNKINTTVLNVYKNDQNIYKTGLYVKDRITGIGTLSFIDPNTKLFGALGHEIMEKSTGKILEIKHGKIFETSVNHIDRSEVGVPGEKNAQFFSNNIFGKVAENTDKGIFGNYTSVIPDKKLYKVAKPTDIKLGEAKIMTVLRDAQIEDYDIKITKINSNLNQKTKNIIFEITDGDLIKETGGIVQGMSGSPIIQGEYIVGAITHVVIDNPTKGYGIFITNMLEEAEN